MSILDRIRLFLDQDRDLVALVLELKGEGVSQRVIYDSLEMVRQEFEAQGRTREDDYLIEVGDRVWGNCSSKDQLFDTHLSN
jgi:hypothetical protein